MKTYKASVYDKDTKRYVIIESEYNRKSDFISDLRLNGYRVNPTHVKEKDVFDYITENTNCNWWDWKEIKTLPTL
jgi:hypothetical protein